MPRRGRLPLVVVSATPAVRFALGSVLISAATCVAPVGASDHAACPRPQHEAEAWSGGATSLGMDEVEELEALEIQSMQVQLLQRPPAKSTKTRLQQATAVFGPDAEASEESVAADLAGATYSHPRVASGHSSQPVTLDDIEEVEALEVDSIRVQMLQSRLLRPKKRAATLVRRDGREEEFVLSEEVGADLLSGDSLREPAASKKHAAANGTAYAEVATVTAEDAAALSGEVGADLLAGDSLREPAASKKHASADGTADAEGDKVTTEDATGDFADQTSADLLGDAAPRAPVVSESAAEAEDAAGDVAGDAAETEAALATSLLQTSMEMGKAGAEAAGTERGSDGERGRPTEGGAQTTPAPSAAQEASTREKKELSEVVVPVAAVPGAGAPSGFRGVVHRAFAFAGWEIVEFKLHHAVVFILLFSFLASASFGAAIFLHAVFVRRCLASSPKWRRQYLKDTKRFRQESCLPPQKSDERLITESLNTYPSTNVDWRVPAASAGFDCAMVKPTSSGEPLRLEGTIEGALHADPLISPLKQRACVMYTAGVWQPEIGEPLAAASATVGFTVSLLGSPQTRVQVQGGDAILFDAHGGEAGGACSEEMRPDDAPEHCREFLRVAVSAAPVASTHPGRRVAVSDAPLLFQERALLVGSTVTLVGELHRGVTGALSLRPWQRETGGESAWTPEAVKEPEGCVVWEPWKSTHAEGQAVLGGLMNVLVSDDPELLS